ncbi:MAG: tetratricopeptide repeat protein, partial [Deltaproteobacteria bacterium]
PLLVKVSYHPNWSVEGADRIYLASPSFMLLRPKSHQVRLKFVPGLPETLGKALTMLGVLLALASWIYMGVSRRKKSGPHPLQFRFFEAGRSVAFERWSRPLHRLLVVTPLLVFVVFAVTVHHRDPTVLYSRGKELVEQQKYEEARKVLESAIGEFPLSPVSDFTVYLYAVSYFEQANWEKAIEAWRRLVDQYPESTLAAESYYHMGLCWTHLARPQKASESFRHVMKSFPNSRWAGPAEEKLEELKNSKQ